MENGNMTPLVPRQDGRLEWGNGVVSMLFDIAADSPVRLCRTSGYIAPEQMLPGAKAEPRADIYSLGMVLGEMAKATGDKALSKMAEICSCRDPQSRPQNIVQLRQRLSCTPRYRHALLLLCALIIALLAALAGSYYHLEKNAQEPASSASDSIQPNDNKVIDYQLWDK